MEQDLLVAIPDFLLADVVERIAQRLDGGFNRRFDVAPLELEAVDLALDILETALCLVEEQLRSPARFAKLTACGRRCRASRPSSTSTASTSTTFEPR